MEPENFVLDEHAVAEGHISEVSLGDLPKGLEISADQVPAVEEIRPLKWLDSMLLDGLMPRIPVGAEFLGREPRATRMLGIVMPSISVAVEA